MFGKIKEKFSQLKMMKQMMSDENFKAFISHPKVQTLFKDPDFQKLAKSQNMSKMATHPKLAFLMKDPEVSQLIKKLDPEMLQGMFKA